MGGTIGLISSMYSTTKLIVFTQSTTVQKLPYLCAVWCEPQKCGRSRRGSIESTPFKVVQQPKMGFKRGFACPRIAKWKKDWVKAARASIVMMITPPFGVVLG